MAQHKDDNGFDPETIVDHVTFFRLNAAGIQSVVRSETVWWSVLIELDGISIDQFVDRIRERDYDTFLIVPAAYDSDDRSVVLPFQPVTVFATTDLVQYLNDDRSDLGVATLRVGGIIDEMFLNPDAQSAPLSDIDVAAGTVVQAFVDDGMGIAHDLFRSGPTSSRVYFAQIFDAVPLPASPTSIGRTLERDDINALLTDCTYNGVLDEELFYTRSGQVNLAEDVFSTVANRASHGTHVMGLGAGHEMSGGVDDRPIICAALPSRVVKDTSGVDLLPLVYLSFHILVKQARRFRLPDGGLAPVVFNFSYGNLEGPHDGTGIYATMFERYFGPDAQACAEQPQKAWLTLPAGNANLSRLHAVNGRGLTDTRIKLDLVVLPDDTTPTHVQFWMPSSGPTNPPNFAKIKVRSPFGTSTISIKAQPGQAAEITNDNGARVAWLAYRYVGGTTQRGLVTLSITPTASVEEISDLAPAGIWTIKVRRRAPAGDDPIHIWVDRDDTLPGHGPGGRQAFFDNPDYVRFGPFGAPLPVDPPGTDCPVRRSTTISGFSCGPSPIVVAAYTEQEAVLSDYSAAGPLNPSPHMTPPPREGPDLAARGDDSWVLRGVYSAGSRSGSWVRGSGTSASAPQVARLAAGEIGTSTVDGRTWAQDAVRTHPFALEDSPSVERAGDGGIKLPDGGP
ncbi:S8 family serine peptidase [uncultured Tateyamaria sp.]|uniref:S8 family serine peptidase n=1 Tax=Tateyamaria sp. 1078 TaxID=3417464 RepID=UPI00260AFE35|nr:S8 family serine peptidase [uncultured Tateyamaria sp.]